MTTHMQGLTTGNKVTVKFGGGCSAVFVAGGEKRHETEPGFVTVNGEVRAANGDLFWALLEIDESGGGEHCGTGIFTLDGGIAWQENGGFLEAIGREKDEFFPYKYKQSVLSLCHNHHIDENGWSL